MTSTSPRPAWLSSATTGHRREVGPGEDEADGVGVLLHHSLDHLLWGLVQAGVDHFETAVAPGAGDDLGARSCPSRPGLATTTL